MNTHHQETIDERFRHAELLLSRRVEAVGRRLTERLVAVRAAHGLTWRDLLASQREVQRNQGTLAELSVEAFVTGVANPRAKLLHDQATEAIDDAREPLTDAVLRFRRTVQPVQSQRFPTYDPELVNATLQTQLSKVATNALDRAPLEEIGRRWQSRLRRAAALRAAPQLALSPLRETGRLIAAAEMDLLETAPWSHGDRLLSAYERVYADSRTHLRETVLDAAVATPGRRIRFRPPHSATSQPS